MTRAELRLLLKRRLGNRSDVTDSVADLYLDQGILDLTTVRVSLRSLELVGTPISTVANLDAYTYDSTAMAILYIEDTTNSRKLTRYPGGFDDYLLEKQSITAAKPSRFIEYGSKFFINEPDAVYTLQPYYYLRASIGTADGASPTIEPEWHYPIILAASILALHDFGDDERAGSVEQELSAWGARRDTARRITARFNRPSGGVRPHSAWLPGRTGV